jgi:hypothetical protein
MGARARMRIAAAVRARLDELRDRPGEAVRVVVTLEDGAELASLEAAGLRVRRRGEGMVSGTIPAAQVPRLAAREGVLLIELDG